VLSLGLAVVLSLGLAVVLFCPACGLVLSVSLVEQATKLSKHTTARHNAIIFFIQVYSFTSVWVSSYIIAQFFDFTIQEIEVRNQNPTSRGYWSGNRGASDPELEIPETHPPARHT
jgi:hypothetical protein